MASFRSASTWTSTTEGHCQARRIGRKTTSGRLATSDSCGISKRLGLVPAAKETVPVVSLGSHASKSFTDRRGCPRFFLVQVGIPGAPRTPGLGQSRGKISTSYSGKRWSTVMSVNASVRACAISIRSNGSLWCSGRAPAARAWATVMDSDSKLFVFKAPRRSPGASRRPAARLMAISQVVVDETNTSTFGLAMVLCRERRKTEIVGQPPQQDVGVNKSLHCSLPRRMQQ